jgi:methylmalonyl-CoA mutase C-terminal domain/subunit
LFPRVVQLLREQGARDVVVFAGGIIPKDDVEALKEQGIEQVFTPGAATTTIIEWLRARLPVADVAS